MGTKKDVGRKKRLTMDRSVAKNYRANQLYETDHKKTCKERLRGNDLRI
uniref:Transcriptional regulator n=1 Tax=Heterorhabditis bacteriophora TaxID=37862 RepID=A0A1I7WQM1_HETBA